MEIVEPDKFLHWNYFLAIEEDLYHLARFVEFSKENFTTYSIEFTRILLTSSAEVDVVAKQLCDQFNPGCGASTMNQYRNILRQELPVLAETHVDVSRYGLRLQPWVDFQKDENPKWWHADNNVKPHRHEQYSRANLENVLDSVAGFFLVLLFFYKKQATSGRLKPNPCMLRIGPPLRGDTLFWDRSAYAYRLDKNSLSKARRLSQLDTVRISPFAEQRLLILINWFRSSMPTGSSMVSSQT
jgi:hypothetical protein